PKVVVESALADIPDHADNFANGFRVQIAVADLLSDGVFAGKILVRERLIDDDLLGFRGIVIFGEEPSTDELSFERGVVAGRDIPLIDLVVLAIEGLANDANPVGIAVALDGQVAGDADGKDAGES